jgi:hypothetical protein
MPDIGETEPILDFALRFYNPRDFAQAMIMLDKCQAHGQPTVLMSVQVRRYHPRTQCHLAGSDLIIAGGNLCGSMAHENNAELVNFCIPVAVVIPRSVWDRSAPIVAIDKRFDVLRGKLAPDIGSGDKDDDDKDDDDKDEDLLYASTMVMGLKEVRDIAIDLARRATTHFIYMTRTLHMDTSNQVNFAWLAASGFDFSMIAKTVKDEGCHKETELEYMTYTSDPKFILALDSSFVDFTQTAREQSMSILQLSIRRSDTDGGEKGVVVVSAHNETGSDTFVGNNFPIRCSCNKEGLEDGRSIVSMVRDDTVRSARDVADRFAYPIVFAVDLATLTLFGELEESRRQMGAGAGRDSRATASDDERNAYLCLPKYNAGSDDSSVLVLRLFASPWPMEGVPPHMRRYGIRSIRVITMVDPLAPPSSS